MTELRFFTAQQPLELYVTKCLKVRGQVENSTKAVLVDFTWGEYDSINTVKAEIVNPDQARTRSGRVYNWVQRGIDTLTKCLVLALDKNNY